jgi:hypothetical protein
MYDYIKVKVLTSGLTRLVIVWSVTIISILKGNPIYLDTDSDSDISAHDGNVNQPGSGSENRNTNTNNPVVTATGLPMHPEPTVREVRLTWSSNEGWFIRADGSVDRIEFTRFHHGQNPSPETDDSTQNLTAEDSNTQNLIPEASNTGNLKRKDEEGKLGGNLPYRPKTEETGEGIKRARTDGDTPILASMRLVLGPGTYSRPDSEMEQSTFNHFFRPTRSSHENLTEGEIENERNNINRIYRIHENLLRTSPND